MNCTLDGREVSPEVFSFRELGFGKPVTLPLHQYTLAYDKDELLGLLDTAYLKWITEMKTDFETTGDPYPEYLSKLRFPALPTLLKHDKELCRCIEEFLYRDLFENSFPWSAGEEHVRWMINTIEMVECFGEMVMISGEAFKRVGSSDQP
jgi:hypothetical protein